MEPAKQGETLQREEEHQERMSLGFSSNLLVTRSTSSHVTHRARERGNLCMLWFQKANDNLVKVSAGGGESNSTEIRGLYVLLRICVVLRHKWRLSGYSAHWIYTALFKGMGTYFGHYKLLVSLQIIVRHFPKIKMRASFSSVFHS